MGLQHTRQQYMCMYELYAKRSELIREKVYKVIRLNCVLHSMEVHVWVCVNVMNVCYVC